MKFMAEWENQDAYQSPSFMKALSNQTQFYQKA